MKKIKNIGIYFSEKSELIERLIVNEDIFAGFPSPAEDFKEVRISLDKELVKNEDATFYARVRGNFMIDANIEDGDLVVIDRSIETRNSKKAVCMIDRSRNFQKDIVEDATAIFYSRNAQHILIS